MNHSVADRHPGVLLVLDGWGYADSGPTNPLSYAHTPVLNELIAKHPSTLLEASGSAVGLLPDTVGNSEIGHLVIGAGRPLLYDSLLVQQAIDSGDLRTNATLVATCQQLAANNHALHLIGLCSDGQIHSSIDHVGELLAIAAAHHVPRVWIHVITDGRDVADGTAEVYLRQIEQLIQQAGIGRVATVTGRGYALDKAGALHLTRASGVAIADGDGPKALTAAAAIAASQRGDEWVTPTVLTGHSGQPLGTVGDGDAVLFFNFRSDRIQQLADFLVAHVALTRRVETVSLAQYDTRAAIPALVARADAAGGLGDQLASYGLKSVRIAEVEKFEHVTFFLNGRAPGNMNTEEHIKVEGHEEADYIKRPEMNIDRVVKAVIDAAGREDVALVVANLANIDVVGHTGDTGATVKAAEFTDTAVSHILEAARTSGRWVLLVGDHGNAEVMAKPGPDGQLRAYGGHTTNPVPVVVVPAHDQLMSEELPRGRSLADIAPTILGLLGCPTPATMTGRSLI